MSGKRAGIQSGLCTGDKLKTEVKKMGKLKEKVKGMNPKKGFCNLIICAVIFFIIAVIGAYIRFGDRVPAIKQELETVEKTDTTREEISAEHDKERSGEENIQEEYGRKEDMDKEPEHDGHEAEWKIIAGSLTTGDYLFFGSVIAVFWIILCIYWLYTTAFAVSKSWETGANAWLFGLLTLVTNIFGLVCLWIYIKIHAVCPGCGRLQSRKANYCTVCGTEIYTKCPDCGSRISVADHYCKECGRKMKEL